MQQFRSFNPLASIAGVQGIASQAQGIRTQRQGNKLQEILQPLKVQEAQAQGRQLNMEEAGREAQYFMSALGDVDPSTPEGMQAAQQRWSAARQALGQVSDDVDEIPEQFDPQALQTIQGIAAQYGSQDGDTIQSTYVNDKGQRIGLFRSGRETVLGNAYTGLKKVDVNGREMYFDEIERKLIDPADVEKPVQDRKEISREESELAADRRRQEKEAEESVKVGSEMFQQARAARASLGLYDEAIQALQNGANTGAIASVFPTIQGESKRLENIQNQLGLSVIQSTTFGALSEKEMRLAMETAIPTGLDEPQLIEWLKQKQEAQRKAAEALENAAAALLSGDMTLSDMARVGQDGETAPEQPQQAKRFRYNPETGQLEPQ